MGIGILGGTFDPIHSGHLIIAEEAKTQLKLNQVLLLPAGQPWLKVNRVITPPVHRVAMIGLAIETNPEFKLSTIEIERAGPSYTVDTIKALQTHFGSQAKLFFLLGWDSLNELPLWKEAAKLVKMCQLVAIPRQDCPKPDLNSLEALIPGIASNTILLDMPFIGISSSEIRKRVAAGKSIRYLVPEPVERYIAEHRLYR